MEPNFEIYHVVYRPPIFSPIEGEKKYGDPMNFLVSTPLGRKDAEETCKRYHPNCKIEEVQTRLEDAADVHVNKSIREKRAAKKKAT